MIPTDEQQAILEAARNTNQSLMISAYAGCAKTTTLEMIAKALPIRPSLALAFNVKVKKEMEKRFPKHFEVLTLNGLGHRAWSRTLNQRCSVNTNKLFDTLKETFSDLNLPRDNDAWATVSSLIKGARHAGLVPEPHAQQFPGLLPDDWTSWEAIADDYYLDINDELVWASRRALTSLIKKSMKGELDYDDQIYMPTLFGGVFPRFAIVMVDEAQDLSPLNHKQVAKTSIDRLIVVGDPRQAIYAFRGADSSSMDSMSGLRDSWTSLPLSTTFRCPRSVVQRQLNHAPGFSARDPAPEGLIHVFPNSRPWSITDVQKIAQGSPIAFLCRNNAPIIAAALRIIRGGLGCTVLGSEIGKSLITLSKRILPEDGTATEQCRELIMAWKNKETSLARANEKEERIAIITDRAECLLAVLNSQSLLTSGDIRGILKTMFSKESLNITLSTGHKAKGMEFPVVVHLDPFRIPSKYAKKAANEGNMVPMEQDLNLRYVIETRTQNTLILANLEDMQ